MRLRCDPLHDGGREIEDRNNAMRAILKDLGYAVLIVLPGMLSTMPEPRLAQPEAPAMTPVQPPSTDRASN